MSSSSSSSYSSLSDSCSGKWVYDVFLCFRGETRYTFTSHLYEALCQKKVNAFLDDMLDRGKDLSTLLRRIEGSAISVIIFSQNFASSTWCLDEVVKIVECMKTMGRTVLPIFHCVDTDDVTEEMGGFAAAIAQQEEPATKKQMWKEALKIAAAQAGWDSKVTRPDSKLVEAIVKDVVKKLNVLSPNRDYMKFNGLDARIWEIKQQLCFGLDDVRLLGIWGMGGIGKTTIAKALFKEVYRQFEHSSFCGSIDEKSRRCGLDTVKQEIYSNLWNEKNSIVSSFDLHNNFNILRLQRSKVLIVLDDVGESLQLQELLLEGRDSFGTGSRIIVTSRNRQALKNVVDAIYEVQKLSDSASLELFSSCAFKQNNPPQERMKQIKVVVKYCRNNPLALKVMGSTLFDKSIQEWESAMNGLGKLSNPEIQNVLRLSFDRLSIEEQKLFLDIVCFFRGKKRDGVTNILDGCYSSIHFKISLLIDKSLVTVSHDKLEVHDLLQELGRAIVNEEAKPKNRSRLWDPEDVHRILTRKKHLVKLKRIDLKYSKHLDKFPDLSEAKNTESINLEGCENMVDLPSSIQHLDKLEYLNLRFCENLRSLPNKIGSEVLSFFELSFCSNITKCPAIVGNVEVLNLSWTAIKELPQTIHELKVLRGVLLTGCPNITKFPEIPTNVRRFYLNDTAVREVPISINLVTRLVTLDLSMNRKLSSLSDSIWKLKSLEILLLCHCPSFESFPEVLEPMERLTWLNLQKCKNLRRLPSSISKLKRLEHLNLSETGIKELPSSIAHLDKLKVLKLDGCKRLSYLPSSIHNLQNLCDLTAGRIEGLELFPHDLGSLFSLRSLDLSGSSFESIPASIQQLFQLCTIDLRHCTRLHSLPIYRTATMTPANNPSPCSKVENFIWLTAQEKIASRELLLNKNILQRHSCEDWSNLVLLEFCT